MTVNDILNGRKSATQFYDCVPALTISDAALEPLKLKTLRSDIPHGVVLPNGEHVPYDEAFVIACLNSIDNKLRRKSGMPLTDKQYVAGEVCRQYGHYSVCELKCFENMLLAARLPTFFAGQEEYVIGKLDIANVMSKLRAYDKLRPYKATQQGQSGLPSRPHIWETNPDAKRFDLQGVEHPEGWDYQTYWTSQPDPDEIEPIVQKIKSLRLGNI